MNSKYFNILIFKLLPVENSITFRRRSLITLYHSQALKKWVSYISQRPMLKIQIGPWQNYDQENETRKNII